MNQRLTRRMKIYELFQIFRYLKKPTSRRMKAQTTRLIYSILAFLCVRKRLEQMNHWRMIGYIFQTQHFFGKIMGLQIQRKLGVEQPNRVSTVWNIPLNLMNPTLSRQDVIDYKVMGLIETKILIYNKFLLKISVKNMKKKLFLCHKILKLISSNSSIWRLNQLKKVYYLLKYKSWNLE